MALAIYTSAAFTVASGVAVAANADVEVRRESDNGLAAIFSDRAGSSAITQPGFQADASGRFEFYAAGIDGGYKVTVTKGAESYTVRYQAVGLAAERDCTSYGAQLMAAADAAAARTTLSVYSQAQDDAATVALQALLAGYIQGLTYANNSGDATNDIDIAPGVARSSDNTAHLVLAATLTKRLDAAWAVGTNQGGLDTGSIGNSDYYIHLIKRSDTGVVDALFSLSHNAPTMPANYDKRRLIGWFKRVSAAIVAFRTFEESGGGIDQRWDTPTTDVNVSNTLTTSRRLDAVKVPLNFAVLALVRAYVIDGSSNQSTIIQSPDETDAAPAVTTPGVTLVTYSTANGSTGAELEVRTNASGQIVVFSNIAT